MKTSTTTKGKNAKQSNVLAIMAGSILTDGERYNPHFYLVSAVSTCKKFAKVIPLSTFQLRLKNQRFKFLPGEVSKGIKPLELKIGKTEIEYFRSEEPALVQTVTISKKAYEKHTGVNVSGGQIVFPWDGIIENFGCEY